MEDLFRSYWWLIFPLGSFVYGGFHSWLSYKADRDTIELIKAYAQAGRDPPPELLAKLDKRRRDDDDGDELDGWPRHRRRRQRTWYQVVLFAGLCAGFAFAAVTNMFDVGEAFTIVAFVMAALSLASVVSILVDRTPRD